MRKTILDTIGRAAIHRRGAVFAVWGVLAAVAAVLLATSGLHIDTSRQAMVSEDNVHSRRYQDFLREFGTPLHLVVVIEGDEPASNRAYADALAAELAKQPDLVGDVLYKVDYDVMRDYALLYAPQEELAELRSRLTSAVEALGLTGPSDRTVSFDGLTGALARANALLSSLEEGDTEGWTRAEKLSGRADELDQATESVFRVLREALTTEGWTELALVESVGATEVAAAGVDAQGYLSANGGRLQFLFVQPASPSEQVSYLVPMVEAVQSTAERLRPDGVTVGLTGSPAFVVEEMAQIQHDMLVTSLVSVVVVLALFLLAYRSIVAGALVFVPLLLGVLVTLGIVSVTIGRLNLMSSMFLAILVGLGVDFGIHLLARFDEEMGRGRSLPDAITGTLRGAGPGVVTGALTTVAAFAAMTLSDFTAMRELGAIAGLGVLVVLVATLMLLPCLLAVRASRGYTPTKAAAAQRRPGLVARLVSRPWPTLVVVLLATAALATAIRPIRFDFDIKQFLPADSPAMAALEKLEQSEFYNPDFAIMVASSLGEAREWTRELEQRKDVVARVESLATYLPADQAAKAAVVTEVKELARRFPRLTLEAAPGPSGERFREELAQLVEYLEVDVPLTLEMHGMGAYKEGTQRLAQQARRTLSAIADVPNPVLSARLANLERRLGGLVDGVQRFVRSDRVSVQPKDLPADLLNQYYREADGRERFVVRVFPKGSIADPEFMSRFKDTLTALYPETTGYPITFLEFGFLLREGLERSAFWAMIAIVVLLLVDFRSVRHTVASLFPLLLGAAWMLAAMNLFGIGYNFANLMAIPLIIGIGIDSGVHVMHRTAQGTPPSRVAETAGRAVTISSLTTMASFGSMILADHRGMQSLGETLLVGMAACLVLSVVALPALLQLVQGRGAPDAD